MQILYTILLYLIQPLVWLKLLWRSRKAPAYRYRWLERYGFCKNLVTPNGILVHSVSVGETIAAVPLVKALQARYPDLPITVTTMTPTGSSQVLKSFGTSVSHVYLPYDLPCAIHRFLKQIKPKIVIIMETELWPNLISQLHNKQIPLIIANARLSERSARGYAKLGQAMQQLMIKIPHIAAQNQADGERFLQLGLPKTHLTVTGSIKFDIALSESLITQLAELKQQWQLKRTVWIAASTHHGEDEIILAAHKMLLSVQPDLLLILVPRHPERFKQVEKLIIADHFTYVKQSEKPRPTAQTQIVLGDTMGELMLLYGMADIAFVGGSLIERGGHNPLEAALFHLPIIMGQSIFNFQVICNQLVAAGGLKLIEADKKELFSSVNQLITHQQNRQMMGERAFNTLKQNQGALNRLLDVIAGELQ